MRIINLVINWPIFCISIIEILCTFWVDIFIQFLKKKLLLLWNDQIFTILSHLLFHVPNTISLKFLLTGKLDIFLNLFDKLWTWGFIIFIWEFHRRNDFFNISLVEWTWDLSTHLNNFRIDFMILVFETFTKLL